MGRTDAVAQQTHDVLLAFLRERQPELATHLRDVGHLATHTGRRLGLEGEELEELRLAAELHDIGKAAIPDSILSKPGPLNDDEWKFMIRHTIVGERILATVPELRSVARLVRSSLERWDGTGYPDGLCGAEIPLGSRIVFACDAFHAMTSVRPYYPARDPQEAIEELRHGAGTQFDPQVVDALVAMWDEMGARLLAGVEAAASSTPPPAVLSGS